MADEDDFDLEKPTRQFTKGLLAGFWDWWTGRDPAAPETSKRGILIIGPGGTGKSTFARFLSGQLTWLDDAPGRYRESTDLECFTLADDEATEVLVAPGQEYRRGSTWPDLLTQVSAGVFRGIVVLNCYGYHTFSTPSYKYHQLYNNSKPEFWTAYLSDRRAEEIRILGRLTPHLSVCSRRCWILSLVTKQDLWGSKQGDVEEHYLRGAYAAALNPIAQALGTRLFRHETVFASLIIQNLQTLEREPLASTEAGYDIERMKQSIDHLLSVLAGLRAWEGES